jgi:hypothetical protein
MPSLIKDLAGFFLGSAPDSAKARGPQPTTPTQRGGKPQRDDKKDAWWWENREADHDVFASSRHRAHLPRCKRTGRPLKILALHGRGSNNDITSIQLSSLEVPTRCVADLLSAPHDSSPQSDVFHMLSNRPFHEWGHDEEALKGVLAYIERYGPYDGRRRGLRLEADLAFCDLRLWRPAAGRRDREFTFFADLGRSGSV